MRPPLLRIGLDELIVDSFAGGGGASTGIEAALGRPVDIAINHSPHAIEMHAKNHPDTKHYLEDVWKVDPVKACEGKPVGLLWASPDCRHFSKAKGSQPVKKKIRGLAWVVTRWARAVRPRVIVLENVPEFETWGPVVDGRPDPARTGKTFRAWRRQLESLGYQVEFRTLVAADYGTPTIRKRLFMVARCDGAGIEWPSATHGRGTARQWIPASEVIDWSLPCPSIFDRSRPLAEATLRRIAEGIRRYVLESPEPFVVRSESMVAPFLVRHGHYSTITGAGLIEGRGCGTFRGQQLGLPLATVCATNDKHLVAPIITKHYGGVVGHDVNRALGTVTAKDHHALTAAFLMKYYGTGGQWQGADEPLHTVTGKARFGLVTVHGEQYEIADIGTRMLQPHELFAAQGFPKSYQMTGTKTEQTALAGNSVCPPVAEAIVRSNCVARREALSA